TLLPSGKVLLVGGSIGGAYLTIAQLYDPVTATFSGAGSLQTPRFAHRATVLPSGTVLVTGGWNGGPVLTAELFDPAVTFFRPLPTPAVARSSHTATLLPSGKVLLTGGDQGNVYLNSVETFDEGAGYPSSLRPTVSSFSGTTVSGATITVSGSTLRGAGEGSSGGSQSSATNYPLVRLTRDENEQVLYATTSDASGSWKDVSTSVTAVLPASMQGGIWRLQVVTNGIPGVFFPLPATTCDDGNACTNDSYDVTTGACTHANNTASCNDGNACTTGD